MEIVLEDSFKVGQVDALNEILILDFHGEVEEPELKMGSLRNWSQPLTRMENTRFLAKLNSGHFSNQGEEEL